MLVLMFVLMAMLVLMLMLMLMVVLVLMVLSTQWCVSSCSQMFPVPLSTQCDLDLKFPADGVHWLTGSPLESTENMTVNVHALLRT